MILDGQLVPGERIPEAKVAEEFGTSRTPVRDAMRQLSNEGLVEIFPNRFAQVAVYTPEKIRETGMMRLTLDQLAVRLAMLYGSRADFIDLRKEAEACVEQGSESAVRHRLDCDFHMKLSQISRSSLLMKFQNELYLRVLFITKHYPDAFREREVHSEQHFLMIDAMLAQDEEKALAILTDHIATFYDLHTFYPDNFFLHALQ